MSYCELTGKSYAEHIAKIFATRNQNTFVSGSERPYITGNWETFIDKVIKESKIFILLLTIDTLESNQVKREIEQLKKKGITYENFWIARHNVREVPRKYELHSHISKNISDIMQIDFEDETKLGNRILQCYDDQLKPIDQPETSNINLIKSDYNFLTNKSKFNSGDINCWKTGLFTFDDINGDFDARRPELEKKITNQLEQNNVILLGETYSGKSILLKRIALEKIKNEYTVLYIREFGDNLDALINIIEQFEDKQKLLIIIDNIYNTPEVLKVVKISSEVRFLFAGINERLKIIITELDKREQIQEIKRALNSLSKIEVRFDLGDAIAFWLKIQLILGGSSTIRILMNLTHIENATYYYNISNSNMLLYFAYLKSHIFEKLPDNPSIDILENEFIVHWNKIKDLKLRKSAIFCSIVGMFGFKITPDIISRCNIDIQDLIKLVKNGFLIRNLDGYNVIHEKWAIEFISYIYRTYYENNEKIIHFQLSIKEILECVLGCLDIHESYQAIFSCINFYYETRYREIINAWIREARFFSYPKINSEERMKILAQGIGSFYFHFRLFKKELEVNDEAIKIYPDSPIPWKYRGDVLDNLERYDEAIDCYTKAIQYDKQYIHAWVAKGVSLRNKANFQLSNHPMKQKEYFKMAHECFDKALEYDEKNTNLLKQIGLTLSYQKQYEEALKYYEKALEKKSLEKREEANLWFNISIAYHNLNKDNEELDSLNKCTNLYKAYPKAWLNKAILQNKLKMYTDAIFSMNTLLEMYPDFTNGWKFKADIEKKIEMEREASISLAKYEELKKKENMTNSEVRTFKENRE